MSEAADKSTGIRIVKKKRGHEGHHGGAWKVAYADFVTAMMAFFLVMWIIGLNQNIKEAIAGYFKDPIKFMEAVVKGNAPFTVAAASKLEDLQNIPRPNNQEIQGLAKAKQSIEKIVANTPEFRSLRKYIDIKLVDEGLRIDLLEVKESLFFDSASARVKPSTRHLLSLMAAELGKLTNKVIIEGHTDSRPLNRKDGYTNWELSADRANAARRVMEHAGLRSDQVAQVRGYADTQPREPRNPTHFSNRRVSIVVMFSEMMNTQRRLVGTIPNQSQFNISEKSVSPAITPSLSQKSH